MVPISRSTALVEDAAQNTGRCENGRCEDPRLADHVAMEASRHGRHLGAKLCSGASEVELKLSTQPTDRVCDATPHRLDVGTSGQISPSGRRQVLHEDIRLLLAEGSRQRLMQGTPIVLRH